jgi:hypothetical protein
MNTFAGRIRRAALGTAVFCALSGSLMAQSTTQGAIAGTVEDATGAVIGDATVKIHNDATDAEITVTGDASGNFNAPLVEPGTYTVTISAPGFGSVVDKSVVVEVGQPTTLMPHMTAGSTEEAVTVSAEAVSLNFESPDLTSVLPGKAIEDIPVQNRRWSALALTTPGVVADASGFGLISVHGMSTVLNDVLIDGADDNQAYFSEERGRTREGYSTAESGVLEFQVNSGVYSAEFGRSIGTVINSVTKSGTNQMHGEVFFNDLDRGLGAYDPGSVSPSGAALKPKDLRKIYGFSMGGELIKDKLFWFYTYNQLDHINPGIAKAASYGSASGVGGFLEQPDATVTSCTENTTTGAVTVTGATVHTTLDTQVCALALRENVTYAQGVTNYNSGLAALLTDLGTVPRAGYQEINTPKLDWQVNSRNRATFLFHRLRWDAPGDVQTGTAASYSVDAWGTDFVKLDYGLAKLESQIGSRLSNELLYQYSRELNDEGQQPYSPYTLNNLVAPGGPTILGGLTNSVGGTIPYIALDTSIGFNLGSPYYSYRIKYPDEHKWQVADVLYLTSGNHSIHMGVDIINNGDSIKQTPYYFGDYTYSNIPNFLSDLASKGSTGTCNSSGAGVGIPGGSYNCYSSAYQDFGATGDSISTTDFAGFVQDNWKVSPRLTLEMGLRYDYEKYPAPTAAFTTPTFNSSGTQTFFPYPGLTNHPSDGNNFGPRLGFSADLFGTGKTVLRGGYGIYYGRIINATILGAYFGSGSVNGQYQLASTKPTAAGAPVFPNPFSGGSGSKPSSFFLAPDLQNPAAHEFDMQMQQELGKGTVVQVSYLGALGRTLPNFLDVNLAPPQALTTITIGAPTVSGFGNGPLPIGAQYVVPTFGTCTAGPTCAYPTGYINPNFTNITEVISNVNSSYNGMTVEVLNHSLHSVQFDGNYTWSHALDYSQNATAGTTTNNWLNPYGPQSQNYANSQWNIGNRFVGWILYTIPGIKGNGPLKYATNGWSINDSFQIQNGLPYSATISSGGYNSSQALNSQSWNGAPSPSASAGAYLPPVGINNYQLPRAIVDDFRVEKSFHIQERYELALDADLYNVANHQNYSINTTDVHQPAYTFTSSTSSASTLTYQPPSAPGVGFGSHSTSNDSGFLYTPRELQLQARLIF